MNITEAIVAILGTLVVCCLMGLLYAWVGAFLWNYLTPLTHLPRVTFMQAYAATALLSILAAPFRTSVTTKGQ